VKDYGLELIQIYHNITITAKDKKRKFLRIIFLNICIELKNKILHPARPFPSDLGAHENPGCERKK
jgi:hypothetical protein